MKKRPSSTSSRRLKSRRSVGSWTLKQPKKEPDADPPVDKSNHSPVCPLVGCSGVGHINGKDVVHITLSGCPFYHNMSFAKWIEMCSREEGLVIPQSVKDIAASAESPSKAKNKLDRSYQFKTTQREPLLDDLATPIELYQFRRAQQLVVSTCEMEAKEHLLLCARVASYSSSSENDRFATEQRIRSVIFGKWAIEPWYQSNYPADLCCLPYIYICEFCLTGMRYYVTYHRHKLKCGRTCPPGNEVYRKDNLSFFEIDGEHYQEYCQNLCLMAKLFLQQKTVHELDQVPEFMFYVLTETDQEGSHIIGYFSKQKPDDEIDYSSTKTQYYNLSCILILPPYQCRGFGRMLIEMSYTLSRLEQRIGTPERPLSDLGIIIYRRYWRYEILKYLSNYTERSINIRTMSQELTIAIRDIVSTLLDMKMLICYRTKYYIINNKNDVETLLSQMKPPSMDRRIDPACLHWTPVHQGKSPSTTSGTSQKNFTNMV